MKSDLLNDKTNIILNNSREKEHNRTYEESEYRASRFPRYTNYNNKKCSKYFSYDSKMELKSFALKENSTYLKSEPTNHPKSMIIL